MKKNNANEPNKIKPIICPICGNTELSFVTEKNKNILIISLKTISIIVLFITCLVNFNQIINNNINSGTIIAITLSLFLFLICAIISTFFEHNNIKAICKNCGNIWLID